MVPINNGWKPFSRVAPWPAGVSGDDRPLWACSPGFFLLPGGSLMWERTRGLPCPRPPPTPPPPGVEEAGGELSWVGVIFAAAQHGSLSPSRC